MSKAARGGIGQRMERFWRYPRRLLSQSAGAASPTAGQTLKMTPIQPGLVPREANVWRHLPAESAPAGGTGHEPFLVAWGQRLAASAPRGAGYLCAQAADVRKSFDRVACEPAA